MVRSTAPALSALLIVVWALLHLPLLNLPYHWDEAGYFVPAAYDLYRSGEIVPYSEAPIGHPPAVMMIIAMSWLLFGFSAAAARMAILLVGAAALWAVFRLSERLVNREVAWATVICTALYPLFFVQSTLVHLDLAAAAFSLIGLCFYIERRPWACGACFSAAVLAKETAVLVPMALGGWELAIRLFGASRHADESAAGRYWVRTFASFGMPALSFGLWFTYYYVKTGWAFGNPEFLDYNAGTALDMERALGVLPMRLWHATGHLNLWMLTVPAIVLVLGRPILRNAARGKWEANSKWILLILILSHAAAFSIFGGAVLPRYMLPVIPLVILMAIAEIWRRMRHWTIPVAIAALGFGVALFIRPSFAFDRGDNLAYRDFVLLQRDAARFVSERYPDAAVSTAWPATETFSKPYLGYTNHAVAVNYMADFSAASIAAAATSGDDIAVIFSRRGKSRVIESRYLRQLPVVKGFLDRHFNRPVDVTLKELTESAGDRTLLREETGGEWIAVIALDRPEIVSSRAEKRR